MSKPKSLIPASVLNVAIPQPLRAELDSALFSQLENRVPHGAYGRFLSERLREYFHHRRLDLAPYLGSMPGAYVISGPPEAIFELEQRLKEST